MRLNMRVYGSGKVHVDSMPWSRHAKVTKRRFERVIKRKNRRAERRFEDEQLRAYREADRLIAIEEARENDLIREELYMLDDYYGSLESNEQYADDWDLDWEERYRYGDDDRYDGPQDGFDGAGLEGRVLCVRCNTTCEYDSKFCKECGEALHEAAEYPPWSNHARAAG